MKKIIAFCLALVLGASLVVVFAACNNKPLADFEIPPEGYDGKPVTIKFYSSMGQGYDAILNDYLVEFNELFPNINIEHKRIGDYTSVRDQIKTELGSGQSPNVAFCYSDHVAMYNKSKAVVPLDDLIASDIKVTYANGETDILGLKKEQKDDFIQTYYEEGKSFGDGKMYMLPFAKSTELMYYNVEAFDAIKAKYPGFDVPDHWFATDGEEGLKTTDRTSMEFALAAIKEYDGNCVPLGYDAGDNWIITLFEQYQSGYTQATGDHYLFNTEKNHEILATLRRWFKNNWFTTKGLLGGNTYTSTYFTSTSSAQGKKCYISIGSSAGARNQVPKEQDGEYPFTVGVAMIPQKDPGMTNAAGVENFDYSKCKVISQGPSICIFNSANPQEVVASWLLVKFLTTNAGFEARYGMEAGYLPVIQSVNSIKSYQNAIKNADTAKNMSGMAAKLCIEYREAFFVSPAFYGSAEARDQMASLLEAVCTKVTGTTQEQIMEGIRQQFKIALDKCNE